MKNRFTSAQLKAIDVSGAHLKVIGPSGVGKTTVLAQKIADLLAVHGESGVLVLTPTPQMGLALQAWVGGIVGDVARTPRFTALASIALEYLRLNAESLGLLRYFTTLEPRAQRRWIASSVLNRCPHRSASEIVNEIVRLKSNGIDPAGYASASNSDSDVLQIYSEYQQFLTDNQALDQDEILPLFVQLLRQTPSVGADLGRRFPYWVVDHLEDMSPMALMVLNGVGPHLRQWVVAGDPVLSRFRPHDPVAAFGTGFATVSLDRFPESSIGYWTQLDAWAEGGWRDGDRLPIVLTESPAEEATLVAQMVQEKMGVQGIGANDIAIISPSDTYTVAIESQLRAVGVRIRTVFGQGLPTFAPIQPLLAYLRVIFNPADRLGLAQVLALPPFQLDESEIDLVLGHAQQARDGSVQFSDDGLTPSIKQKVVALVELITHFRQRVEEMPDVAAGLLLDQIADDSGFRELLDDENTIEAIENRQALDDLILDITEWGWTMDHLLDAVVMAQMDDPIADSGAAVTVISAALARGRRFRHVIACGIPFGPLTETAYRAITRSSVAVVLTAVGPVNAPTRIPLSPFATSSWKAAHPDSARQLTELGYPVSEWAITSHRDASTIWCVGDSVSHSLWGSGAITGISGSGDQLTLDVLFQDQSRRLVARYAGLKRSS